MARIESKIPERTKLRVQAKAKKQKITVAEYLRQLVKKDLKG